MKRKPNKFSHRQLHDEYGIKTWFRKIGIADDDLRKRLKRGFLEDFEHDGKSQPSAFIQDNWEKFTRYVTMNRKFFEDYK